MGYDNSTIGDLNKNTEFELSIEYWLRTQNKELA